MKHIVTILMSAVMLITGCQKPADQKTKKTPETQNTTMVLIPKTGMGDVKFGMSMEEMKKVLGKPDRITGNACEYLSKGFAVLPGHEDQKVAAIMCGDLNGEKSTLYVNCKIRTDKGITMGSTEKEIIAAYGQPSANYAMDATKTLAYPTIAALFVLREGKVVHMTFKQK